MEPLRRTYELHSGEWHEIGVQRAKRRGSLLRGLGAFLVTACVMAGIAAVGAVAAGIALVLLAFALLATWVLKAIPVQPMDSRRAR